MPQASTTTSPNTAIIIPAKEAIVARSLPPITPPVDELCAGAVPVAELAVLDPPAEVVPEEAAAPPLLDDDDDDDDDAAALPPLAAMAVAGTIPVFRAQTIDVPLIGVDRLPGRFDTL